MNDFKAADLPEGSVVFADGQCWISGRKSAGLRWRQENKLGSGNDRYMDKLFTNSWTGMLATGHAQVLRHGYGEVVARA